MSHRSSILVATALALLLVETRPGRADAPVEWLRSRLLALGKDARLGSARVGLAVQDVPSGRELVLLQAGELYNVASCAKLATGAAALATLGSEYRFKTVVYVAPPPEKGRPLGPTLTGDLYLKGYGNPALSESDLWQIVDDLQDLGLQRVRGRLVVDESFFDGQRQPPLYESKATDAWYRAPVGAVSLEGNVVTVRVFGGADPADPVRVLLHPRSPYLSLVNRATTVAAGRRSWVKVETRAQPGSTEVVVTGRVRTGYAGRPFRRRLEDPALMTGHALLDLLARRGIRIEPRRVERGSVPPRARPLAHHTSEPLATLLRRMNKRSDNFVAEQILKVMGAEVHGPPGSFDKGLRVVHRHLQSLGFSPGSYTMLNGSGLYDATRFTPLQLVRLLRSVHQSFRVGPDFVSSLSQAGVDGTLEHRFLGSGAERYVRGKTGTLARVVTLAGFAGAAKQRGPLAFAILVNDLPEGKVVEAREVVDEMAAAMVAFLER